MRINQLWIDGYGRFSQREVVLHPGLQVILGPNEQGKTTLRSFIGDMLYGQKRSDSQRLYDEAHELRRPWTNPDVYGGRLVYHLDEGRAIEVSRSFDRKAERVQVYDRTHARDITAEYPKLRNREPSFAEAHLGLSKAVFLSTATISHWTLDGLGDEDALAQIREKILSLADGGEDLHSAEAALAQLDAYAGEIGRPTARTRPLPTARVQLADLNREYEQAVALHRELQVMVERRTALREELEALQARRTDLERDLKAIDLRERAGRVQEAEALEEQIQQITERCFALADVRDFPLEQLHEFQRTENVVATAHAALERTEAERGELRQQLEAETVVLGAAAQPEMHDIPEAMENRLAELEARIQVLRQRLEEVQGALSSAEARFATAQRDLAGLPDFSRMAADPIEWLSGLVSSYRVTRRGRDDERQKLERLRADLERREAQLAEGRRLFGDRTGFMDEAREYEISTRMTDEQVSALTSDIERDRAYTEESAGKAHESATLGVISALGAAVFVGAAYYFSNPFVYLPALLSGFAMAYFGIMTAAMRISGKRAQQQIVEAEAAIVRVREEDRARREAMERLMAETGCQTIRELEALYDRYRDAMLDLSARRDDVAAQDKVAGEEEHHFTRLVLALREKLLAAGEEIREADDVPDAATRAMSRYQEYRDAKRRLTESKDQITHFKSECDKLQRELDARLKEERDLALEVRRLLRDNGFLDEAKHTSAVSAMRAYRMRSAQHKQKRGRIEVLREKAVALDRRLEAEQKDLVKQQEVLNRYLRAAGVDSPDLWRAQAERAQQYRGLWDQRTSLRDRLDLVLRGQDLEALRASVEADGSALSPSNRTADELKQDLGALVETLEARRKEEHALDIALTQRAGATRAVSEIEEERAEVEATVATLELELEAVSYAAAMIEEVARDRHARIAPRLATLASAFLKEITGDAYDELLVSRDLRLSVRIPQSREMNDDPERRLSQGTVDQIYLALRLAMVQCLSENGERIPMLLDDPFANYDDARLEHALRVLARIGETTQILVFTCRDDVARAGQAVGAPILNL